MSTMNRINTFLLLVGLSLVNLQVNALVSGRDPKDTRESINQDRPKKWCLGTGNGLHHSSADDDTRYENYKSMYTNCTYVEHNLEITFLEQHNDYDFSFLENIEEVSGYVLITSVYASYMPLTSLRIIRGSNLYDHNHVGYALWVVHSYKQGFDVGLRELRFKSLSEILTGSVYFFNNNLLCYENTINWEDILSGEGATVNHHFQSEYPRRECGECDASCEYTNADGLVDHHCWGEGPDMCQRLSRVICSPQCDGRCYGPSPQDCCHPECAGGCDGPFRNQCWACLNFENEGSCTAFCPPDMIYNKETYKMVPNPDVKYAYGSKCVDKCPAHLVQFKGACVQDCGNNMQLVDGTCVPCEAACPKPCIVPDDPDFIINAHTIKNFTDCTVIQGSLSIIAHSFEGDEYNNISSMHPTALSVLETVEEITGYLKIQGTHEDFKDLSFLRNLKYIRGRKMDDYQASLQISRTSLESLNLQSLKEITNARVIIVYNQLLCFANTIRWNELTINHQAPNVIKENRAIDLCEASEQKCDRQCSEHGCWGIGDINCVSCANFCYRQTCIESCEPSLGIYDSGNNTCEECHEECRISTDSSIVSCHGPDANMCDSCRNFKDGPFCRSSCPTHKYADSNGICQNCHMNCEHSCTGPLNTVGPGGCTSCDLAMLDMDGNITECQIPNSECPKGYYKFRVLDSHTHTEKINYACNRCHSECARCSGPGMTEADCQECVNYNEKGVCVSNCSSDYFTDNIRSLCVDCDSNCLGCRGRSAMDCLTCRYHKIYWNMKQQTENPEIENRQFNCTEECPELAKFKITEEINGITGSVCVTEAIMLEVTGTKKLPVKLIVGLTVGLLLLLALLGIVFGYVWKRNKAEENKMRMVARMSGLEESEPLTPTDAKPDMATLRLIKESEMRKGNIIGSGAFGTVYKGFWIPESETVKIPVAIKVLQEGTSPSQNKELLEEARIMASVDHPCCIRILAVCMAAQMMLVTQLMPLGCLLDYVRKNKSNTGSKVLLNWCTQIARGMAYLEERCIVHRDLAARNVLVQSPGQVKITDFGLAKLLDIHEEEFHAGGGKMPIKWLALECIQHRIFTHKSDVWSFGVTMWELFTYGQRPYENVRAKDIPELLEKGERLPQPPICTIDVYMIMIKCWMLDAESRPYFKELADEFAKMARDPGRYLVIDGDKLMRLASQPFDSTDLLRNMSIAADSPEDFRIMEADDYLTPRPVSVDLPPSLPPLSQHIPPAERSPLIMAKGLERIGEDSNYDDHHGNSVSTNSTSAGSREGSRERDYPQMAANQGPRRDKKYSGLEAATAARRQRETAQNTRDSVNSRYSSDPCKVIGIGDREEDSGLGSGINDIDLPHMPAPPTPIPPQDYTDGKEGPDFTTVQLPLDEDDYLQPQSSNPRAYMDLVDGGPDYLPADENSNPMDHKSAYPVRSPHKNGALPQQQPQYLDMSSPVRTALDNPEYFDRTEGLPHHALDHNVPNVNLDGLKTDKRPRRLNSVSSESEGASSEHDYYNEFDRLNRPRNPGIYIDPRTESRV